MSAFLRGIVGSVKLVMDFKIVPAVKTLLAPQILISQADTAFKTARPAVFAPETTCVFHFPAGASALTDAYQTPIVAPATSAARQVMVWPTFACLEERLSPRFRGLDFFSFSASNRKR
jgi:hypothetical protein